MNVLKISLKNLFHRPDRLFLLVVVLSLGVAISSVFSSVTTSFISGMQKNLGGIDIVIGPKGSQTQLVLSSVFQFWDPMGNINYDEVASLSDNRLVKEVIELYYGDSYNKSRVVGTSNGFLDLYDAELAKGRLWNRTFEVVVGSRAAEENELEIGHLVYTAHGTKGLGYIHEEYPLLVVGILNPTNTVLDKLILTDIESMWEIHTVDNEEVMNTNPNYEPNREITAAFVKLHQKNGRMSLLRTINQNTQMQACTPSESFHEFQGVARLINRIAQNLVAVFIMLGVISIFFFMMSAVKGKRYEIALMRVMGATLNQVFMITILEALIVGLIGVVLGMIMAHLVMGMINPFFIREFGFGKSFWQFHPSEWIFSGTVVGLCVLAGSIPSYLATRINLSKLLSER